MSTNPLAAYISFTGQSGCYAELPLSVLPGATTFTIEAKLATTSTKNKSNNYTWGTIAGREIGGNYKDDFGLCVNGGKLCFWAEPVSNGSSSTRNTTTNAVINDGSIHKVAVISSNGAIDLYCDGELVAHTNNVNAKITASYNIYLAYNSNSSSYLQMDLYEARFWSVARTQAEIFADIDGTENGLECWLKPTAEGLLDYSGNDRHATLYGNPACNVIYSLPITQQVDVERIVQNTIAVSFTADVERQVKTKWRYYNAGDVHDLTQTPSYLTNLPDTQSKTGVAFYQTTRAKCFDLPATNQIWAKFDVYFDGSNRWRAYNGGSNGVTGITAQTSGDLSFFSNESNVQQPTGICKTNQLQTVLLHMVSGSSDGVIEAWVDGTKIYTYNGDVNHGDDFADFYLQSDGAGTFFSNVIISNSEIGLNDGWQKIITDTERQIKKQVQIMLDVQREFITAIVVPLIGNHFNHLIASLTIPSGVSQRIVLPKRSVAYIRGTGIGSIKVSSDTDATGTVTGVAVFEAGEMYAELGECETVRIAVDSTTVTQQQIEITNLLISDGATNSNYEALTNNTRQILSPDIVSTLIKSIAPKLDVAIFDVIPVDVLLNVERSIPYLLDLNKTNQNTPTRTTKNKPQSRYMPKKTQVDSPIQSIEGIKDFSVTLSEQQLITPISFTTLSYVKIGNEVKVKFLDVEIETKVSSVTYDGQFYYAQCTGDVDKLLYTEICTYNPQSKYTGWVTVDDDDTDEIDLPTVGDNLKRIIKSAGFKSGINIDDYYTTVDYYNTPIVATPYDMIRDMIGWTSRMPHHMINIFTTADSSGNTCINLVERQNESDNITLEFDKTNLDNNSILFSKFTITNELERTVWGSSCNSKTEFRQSTSHELTPRLSETEAILSELPEPPERLDENLLPEHIPAPELPDLPERPKMATVNYITDSDEAHKNTKTKSKSKFEYTDDDLIKRSETLVEGKEEITRTITEYYYETLPSGRKFLAQEVTRKYVGDTGNNLHLDETITIDHTPLMQGQGFVAKSDEDGDINGTTIGGVIPDARVSTYLANKWVEDMKAYSAEYSAVLSEIGHLMGEWAEEHLEEIQNLDDENRSIIATNILNWNSFIEETSRVLTGNSGYRELYLDTEEKQLKEKRTISGWTINDYSLPLAKTSLKKVAARVKALNGATKTTLKVAVYNFSQWITFDKTICIKGTNTIDDEYYLVSNVTTIMPSLPYTVQNLTLVRWDNIGEETEGEEDDIPCGAIKMLSDEQIEKLEQMQ